MKAHKTFYLALCAASISSFVGAHEMCAKSELAQLTQISGYLSALPCDVYRHCDHMYAGLPNLDKTCYMNAVLQAVFNCPEVAYAIENHTPSNTTDTLVTHMFHAQKSYTRKPNMETQRLVRTALANLHAHLAEDSKKPFPETCATRFDAGYALEALISTSPLLENLFCTWSTSGYLCFLEEEHTLYRDAQTDTDTPFVFENTENQQDLPQLLTLRNYDPHPVPQEIYGATDTEELATYRLCSALVFHTEQQHWTAVVCSTTDDTAFHCDDEKITPLTQEDKEYLLTQHPTVTIYQKSTHETIDQHHG